MDLGIILISMVFGYALIMIAMLWLIWKDMP
jgi:hypothetical protein